MIEPVTLGDDENVCGPLENTAIAAGLPIDPGRDATEKWTGTEALNKFWDEAIPILPGENVNETPAASYLRNRCIDPAHFDEGEVRYIHAHFANKKTKQGYPALVVPLREIDTDSPVATHCIRLQKRSDGKYDKISGKHSTLSNGKLGSTAAIFPQKDPADDYIVIVEGIEDAMSINALIGLEAWATCSKGRLRRILERVTELGIDRRLFLWPDPDGDVEWTEAAKRCAHSAEIRIVSTPAPFKDANEIAQACGRDKGGVERARHTMKVAIRQATLVESIAQSETDDFLDGFPKLGFRMGPDGSIQRAVESKDGGTEWTWICSPIRVIALTRDNRNESWGRLLEIEDPDGSVHQWAMPMSLLSTDGGAYRDQLLQFGLRLAPGRAARDSLHTLLSTWMPGRRVRCVERLGWFGETSFVMPKRVLKVPGVGDEEVVFQPSRWPANIGAFQSKGTLDGWRDDVAAACRGNPLLIFAVSVALSGPLLRLLNIEGGGYHYRGESSRGKSTAQLVAGSVWGGGPSGFKVTWRATANGLEGTAAAHCDTFLVLDELGQIEAREAGAAAYMLSNGQGKIRASRNAMVREPFSWLVQFLSSGEISLAHKISEDRGRRVTAGQLVRILDIPATGQTHGLFDNLHDHVDGQSFAKQLKSVTAVNYGHAGPAFVEQILRDLEGAVTSAGELADEVRRRCETGKVSPQVDRAIDRFAVVGAAGELAQLFGITPWVEGEALEAAESCFALWLAQRGSTEDGEIQESISVVRHFIETHGSARFERLGDLAPKFGFSGEPSVQKINQRAGYVAKEDDEVRFYILPEVWRRDVCAGLDSTRVARVLHDRRLLVKGDGRHLTRRLPRTTGARLRAYCVRESILSADEAGSE